MLAVMLISEETAKNHEEFRGDWGQGLNVETSEYEVILLYSTYSMVQSPS